MSNILRSATATMYSAFLTSVLFPILLLQVAGRRLPEGTLTDVNLNFRK